MTDDAKKARVQAVLLDIGIPLIYAMIGNCRRTGK
jgi:hypothetical protein